MSYSYVLCTNFWTQRVSLILLESQRNSKNMCQEIDWAKFFEHPLFNKGRYFEFCCCMYECRVTEDQINIYGLASLLKHIRQLKNCLHYRQSDKTKCLTLLSSQIKYFFDLLHNMSLNKVMHYLLPCCDPVIFGKNVKFCFPCTEPKCQSLMSQLTFQGYLQSPPHILQSGLGLLLSFKYFQKEKW